MHTRLNRIKKWKNASSNQDTAVKTHHPPRPLTSDSWAGFQFEGISIQPKLKISHPNDEYEQEADKTAADIVSSKVSGLVENHDIESNGLSGQIAPTISRKIKLSASDKKGSFSSDEDIQNATQPNQALYDRLDSSRGSGFPLPESVRVYMEPRFGTDFSSVRIHADNLASSLNLHLNAQAFTYGQDIYFGAGRSPGNDILTAHELTHVIQQTGRKTPQMSKTQTSGQTEEASRNSSINNAPKPSTPDKNTQVASTVQRVVELRPPGRGEASAFDRRQELIDRMNSLTTGMRYSLDGRRIVYEVIDEDNLTNFDQQMRDFIDRDEVVPLRLITSAGRVNVGGSFTPLLFDSFISGYADLDDLMASDDHAFQIVLLHFLAERFSVRNYERRIGTNLGPSFDRAHRIGRTAETEYFRSVVGDPTIRFNYEEERPNGTLVVAWKSTEGYRIFHVIRGAGREERGGIVFVRTRDGRRITIEELIAEREAAALVPATP